MVRESTTAYISTSLLTSTCRTSRFSSVDCTETLWSSEAVCTSAKVGAQAAWLRPNSQESAQKHASCLGGRRFSFFNGNSMMASGTVRRFLSRGNGSFETSPRTSSPLVIENANTVTFDEESREALQVGVDTVANAVRLTMGPKGRNVVLAESELFTPTGPAQSESGEGAPRIVNDGVTIAKQIEIEDFLENTGVKLIQQIASKTNDVAGDGTTTACVLAQEMIRSGLIYVLSGGNPISIKRGMDKTVTMITGKLKEVAKPVDNNSMIQQVAAVSAGNDEEIGTMIAKAYAQIGKLGVINVETANSTETTIEIEEGMELERGYLSPQFVTDLGKNTVVLENPKVFLTDMKLTSAYDVLPLMEQAAAAGQSLFIIADDVTTDALQALILNKLMGILSVGAVKAPSFGDRRKNILGDIGLLVQGAVFSEDLGMDLGKVTLDQLGSARRIIIKENKCLIVAGDDPEIKESIKKRIEELDTQIQLEDSDFERDVLHQRISRMAGGVATIKVGAPTETELESKRLRVEDARNATLAAIEEGIVPGGGTAYLKLHASVLEFAKTLTDDDERVGAQIIAKALLTPGRQIADNAGEDGTQVIQEVMKNKDFNVGYNAFVGEFEDLIAAGVLDPVKVERVALQNATSVASLILTTQAVIAEDPDTAQGVFEAGMSGVDDRKYTAGL